MTDSDASVIPIDENESASTSPELSTESIARNCIKRSQFSKISAKARVQERRNPEFYANGEVLFCQPRKHVVDHC